MVKKMAGRPEVIRKDARREKIADEFRRVDMPRKIQIVEIVGIEIAFVRSSIGDQKKQHYGRKQERRQPAARKRGADHEPFMIRGRAVWKPALHYKEPGQIAPGHKVPMSNVNTAEARVPGFWSSLREAVVGSH